MDSQIETVIHFPIYLIAMLYAINAKTMGTKHVFVEVTFWKLLKKTNMWIPLSNKIKNSKMRDGKNNIE
jgi:hypothetical protein